MAWNYRVLAFKQDVTNLPPALAEKYKDHVDFRICEVHYHGNTDAAGPRAYAQARDVSSEDVSPKNIKSLRWQLNKMKEALKKPILWAGERWPEEYKK